MLILSAMYPYFHRAEHCSLKKKKKKDKLLNVRYHEENTPRKKQSRSVMHDVDSIFMHVDVSPFILY